MGLKSYFTPQKLQQNPGNKPADAVPPAIPPVPPVPLSEINTPSNITPWTSRPSSMAGVEMSDTRCEIMVSWLHQQQIEKTWFDGRAKDQGVVIKRSKGDYVSCPENVADEPDGFRRAIELLNVRVRTHISCAALVSVIVLTSIVRHYHQHSCDQDLLAGPQQAIRPFARWTTTSSTSRHHFLAWLPEASIRRLHRRSRNTDRVG